MHQICGGEGAQLMFSPPCPGRTVWLSAWTSASSSQSSSSFSSPCSWYWRAGWTASALRRTFPVLLVQPANTNGTRVVVSHTLSQCHCVCMCVCVCDQQIPVHLAKNEHTLIVSTFSCLVDFAFLCSLSIADSVTKLLKMSENTYSAERSEKIFASRMSSKVTVVVSLKWILLCSWSVPQS